MRNLILIGLGAGLMAWGACAPGTGRPAGSSRFYDAILGRLYGDSVPTVQPAALAARLRHSQPVLLLDTRTPAEYQVSHLQGAEFLDYSTYKTQEFTGVARSRPVVVYCSIGARSQNVGAYLRQLGFTQVSNLYGGLFEWVNEGYPVYNATGPTEEVHPFNSWWGLLLRKGRKVRE